AGFAFARSARTLRAAAGRRSDRRCSAPASPRPMLRLGGPMEAFLRDLKHSLRMFRQSPSFTIPAVAALAFGIGANTAIFSVVNAVLLKPLPFPDADHIVIFMNTSSQGPPGPAASPAKFQHWRQQTDVVQDVAALQDIIVNFTGGDVPQQLHAARVSADYFRLLGAPIRGRSFSPEEDLPNGQKVLVMSHGLWSG